MSEKFRCEFCRINLLDQEAWDYHIQNCTEQLQSRLAAAERDLVASRELIGKAKEALESIAEYWNRNNNEKAMEDACWHSINTAEEALALLSKGKG